MKILVKYLVDSFWPQLEKFENLSSIHSLKVKYEQVTSMLILVWIYLLLGSGIFSITCKYAVP